MIVRKNLDIKIIVRIAWKRVLSLTVVSTIVAVSYFNFDITHIAIDSLPASVLGIALAILMVSELTQPTKGGGRGGNFGEPSSTIHGQWHDRHLKSICDKCWQKKNYPSQLSLSIDFCIKVLLPTGVQTTFILEFSPDFFILFS